MKIFYCITKSEIGGAQVHVRSLVEYMIAQGHSVAVMAAPGGWLEHESRALGAIWCPNTDFKNSFNPLLLFKAYKTIVRSIDEFKPDVVHCHSSFAGFLTRIAVRGGIPTVFTAHSWAFTDGAKSSRKIIAPIAEKIVARYTSKIICVSEYDRQLALRYHIAPEQKLVTIYNGTPLSTVTVRESNDIVQVISVGRLAYPKEYELLIASVAALPDLVRTKMHVQIVGSGPLHDHIANEIQRQGMSQSVTLVGEKKPDEIGALLQHADIFILLSKHEGFPMTILEAMSVGLPVIVSGVGGIPEQVDTKSGIVVSNTTSAVTDALQALITNPTRRHEMGIAAQQRIHDRFSLDHFLRETEMVYNEIL